MGKQTQFIKKRIKRVNGIAKEISWNRKPKLDGSIVYKFVNYGRHWVVKINPRTASNRHNIALILKAQRRKFIDFIYNGVQSIGGQY